MTKKEEKFLRIDAHVHSKGVSVCSQKTCEEVIDWKIEEGYDGAILTNHCQPWYYAPNRPEHDGYIRSVIAEFKRGEEYARQRNFRLFLGLEVTLFNPFYSDWLLYGVTEEFLLKAPVLYLLSQKELFELCQENGILLVHAHPYRDNGEMLPSKGPGDAEYLNGLEINCSAKDAQFKDKVIQTAKEMGALVTCGTDFHGKPKQSYTVGGIFIPESIKTSLDFAKFLKQTEEISLFFGEETFNVPNFCKKNLKK